MPDLLEILLTTRSPSEFDRALRQHGPITEDEVPMLVREANGSHPQRRVNAARALAIAPPAIARSELRKLVRDSTDVTVWAIALEPLLAEPDGSELAALRPETIDAALQGKDAFVLSVGLRAAKLLGQTERLALASDLVDHEDRKVREAAAAFLSTKREQYEAILRRRLAVESDDAVQSTIIRGLLPSNNKDTVEAIKRIYNENENARLRLFNLFRLGGVESPWLNDFLLEIAAASSFNDKGSAILALGARRDRRLLPLCIEVLENTPKRGESGWVRQQHVADSCCEAIRALAGDEQLTPESALDWARAQRR